jgi:hypothetical protein
VKKHKPQEILSSGKNKNTITLALDTCRRCHYANQFFPDTEKWLYKLG